jgi:4-hydroxy-tetrahydrodipicolinate reductase
MDEMESIRDEDTQRALGIPEEFLGGHGYHWIDLVGDDVNLRMGFYTKVNGRDTYAYGAVNLAIPFLMEEIREGSRGQVYSMIDVLRKKLQKNIV